MTAEFERIEWIRDLLQRRQGAPKALPIGPGDDAAVWTPTPGLAAVLTVDAQLEGVHFRRRWLSPRSIGRRAVAAAASDLAAMAARPAGLLLSLTLPADFPEGSFRELFEGCVDEALACGLWVFGGNLSLGPLGITTTVIGEAAPAKAVARDGARAGDAVFVTGSPGRSRLGRALLEAGREAGDAEAAACREAFRHPRARIREALQLVERLSLSALIDISDGLAQDLGHILEASSRRASAAGAPLSAVLQESVLLEAFEAAGSGALTPSGSGSGAGAMARLARGLGLEPLAAILDGGEDFELLFTVPEGGAPAGDALEALGTPLTRIGTVSAGMGGGVHIAGAGGSRKWLPRGHDHFRAPDEAAGHS
jgi:thiamine-monophosphate kinase